MFGAFIRRREVCFCPVLLSLFFIGWFRTWLEVVQRDCQVRGLSKDDATVRGRWRKLIKDG